MHEKQYVTGEALEALIAESGLLGPTGEHNLACVEPNNLTVNTRAMCCTLRQRLESSGVRFRTGAVTAISSDGDQVGKVAVADERWSRGRPKRTVSLNLTVPYPYPALTP